MKHYEGHLRDAPLVELKDPTGVSTTVLDNAWFHVHRVSNPVYWGYWIMVVPDPVKGQPQTLSFHESELTIREIA